MVLPPLDECGNLPPGIHPCSREELVATFGSGSPEREVETQELMGFLDWAHRVGIRRVIVNGSYVTTLVAPNDVDIVILPGADFPQAGFDWFEHEVRWPFLQILIAADEADLMAWCLQDFGTDRNGIAKGVVEVLL